MHRVLEFCTRRTVALKLLLSRIFLASTVPISRQKVHNSIFTIKNLTQRENYLGARALVTRLTQEAENTFSLYRPSVSLGGMSPVSYEVYYSSRYPLAFPPAQISQRYYKNHTTELEAALDMNKHLFEDNEFLEDMVRDLTVFIENQKDTISQLKMQIQTLRSN